MTDELSNQRRPKRQCQQDVWKVRFATGRDHNPYQYLVLSESTTMQHSLI